MGTSRYLLVLVTLLPAVLAGCPSLCTCDLDFTGRNIMTCDRGGVDNLFALLRDDANSAQEVIKISSPPGNPNHLQLGPVFVRYRSLKELYVTFSNIPALGKENFRGMLQLRVLSLSHNSITNLRRANFFGLISLRRLYLDHNDIESITSGTFRHLEALELLDLSYNKISRLVDRFLFGLSELREVDLSGNRISQLDQDVFEDVPRLEIIRCSSCRIRSINPSLLIKVPHLMELDLSFNSITSIKGNLFTRVRKLQKLNLKGNQLTNLPDSFLKGHTMESVELGRNQINRIDSYAFYNTTVTELDISFNAFEDFSGNTIRSLYRHLKGIDLSGNDFDVWRLQNLIRPMRQLEKLTLTDLELSELPQAMFSYHNGLKFLNLSRNYIRHLPYHAVRPLRNLETLDLSFNDIRGASSKSLERFDDIQPTVILHLQGNPFICDDCTIPDFAKWLRKKGQFRSACRERNSRDCLTCKSPTNLYGKRITSLSLEDLPVCGQDYTESFMASGSALWITLTLIFLILIGGGALAALIFYNKQTAHYYTHEEKRTYEDLSSLNDDGVNGNAYSDKQTSVSTIEDITTLKEDAKLNGNG